MDPLMSEDLELMLNTVRRFVARDLEPISRQVEEEDRIPDAIVDKMKDLGLFRAIHSGRIRRIGAVHAGRSDGFTRNWPRSMPAFGPGFRPVTASGRWAF